MTNIEFIRWTIYSSGDGGDISDTDLSSLITALGVNGSIAWLGSVEKNRIAQDPSSVNDGAVSMSWSDRLAALDDIIKTAQSGGFQPPEGENKPADVVQCLGV